MAAEQTQQEARLEVHLRPARPEDTQDMVELTRTIWEGRDYVPRAWPDWLGDEQGHLAVAETEERVVGLAHLARLSIDEWWLEGLRVDPQYEGRGVARQLHDYIVRYWQERCGGVLRLSTYQPAVRHLCESSGFRIVGEYSQFKAPVLDDQPAGGRLWAGVPENFFATVAEQRYARYVDLGWEWAAARVELIAGAGSALQAWSAAGGEMGLLVRDDEEEDERVLALAWVSCPAGSLTAALQEFRRLGSEGGYRSVFWTAPLDEAVLAALDRAGFERAWERFVWLFERSAAD